MDKIPEEKWIDVKEKLPIRAGWYQVKTENFISDAPYSQTLSGKFVWVVPDASHITHWRKKDKK